MKESMEERTKPEAWQTIEQSCKPYGGFVALINKCGGTLISQVWIRSMEEYAELARKEEQEKLRENLESFYLNLSIDIQNELLRQFNKVNCDDWQRDNINEGVISGLQLSKEKYFKILLSPSEKGEGRKGE